MVSNTPRPPQRDLAAFDCPTCGVYAAQQFQPILFITGNSGERAEDLEGGWALSRCFHCRQFALWAGTTLIYPVGLVGNAPGEDMPEDVRALYEEARRVASVSRRAGAAMARATLELLVRRLDPEAPKSASFVQRLDRIIPTVDSSLAQMLTFVRHVGNTIHIPDSADDAVVLVLESAQTQGMEVLFQTINELVEQRITRPKQTEALFNLIPEGVRDRAFNPPKSGQA